MTSRRASLARAALVVAVAVVAAVVLGRVLLTPGRAAAGARHPAGNATPTASRTPSPTPTPTATATPTPTPTPTTDGSPTEPPGSGSRTRPATPTATPEPLASPPSARTIQRWIEEDRLPDAPAHGAVFGTMANDLWRDGAPDVMLFGDSMVQQGVEPAVLERLVRERTGRTVRVFNGGSSRARWGVNLMLARWAAEHDVLPKVAVLAISTLAPKDDDFYTSSAATTPFSAVAEGCDRPGWGPSSRARCARYRDDLQYRFAKQPQMLARAAAGELLPQVLQIDQHAWLRRDGFLFHPSASVRQVERWSAARLADHVPGWPYVTPRSRAQFAALVTLLRAHGVRVLAFSLPYSPVHQRGLEAGYPGYDARRLAAAADLAGSAGVPLVQVASFGSWWGDGDSRDEIHLARRGATRFTQQLWEVPDFRDAILGGIGAGRG